MSEDHPLCRLGSTTSVDGKGSRGLCLPLLGPWGKEAAPRNTCCARLEFFRELPVPQML